MRRTTGIAVVAALLLAGSATAGAASASVVRDENVAKPASGQQDRHGLPAVVVRVNQQGFLPAETKWATLLAPARLGSTRYRLVDAQGHVRFRGTVPSSPVGSWNAH